MCSMLPLFPRCSIVSVKYTQGDAWFRAANVLERINLNYIFYVERNLWDVNSFKIITAHCAEDIPQFYTVINWYQ